MAGNDDYQLDSMEDAAVNNSQTAKRVIAGIGLAAAGAGAAFAFTKLNEDGEPTEEELSPENLVDAAQAGAVTDEAVEEQAEPEPQVVHHYHHYEPEPEPEPEVEVNKTTVIVDEDGNMSIVDEGHYNNRDFAVVDFDGDGDGDLLMYDANGNGIYEDHEKVFLRDGEYQMGQGKEVQFVSAGDEINDPIVVPDPYVDPDPDIYIEEKDDIIDIENDFDERTGDLYADDLAEDNIDYQNDGDIAQYSYSIDEVDNINEEEVIYDGLGDVDHYVDVEDDPIAVDDEYHDNYVTETGDVVVGEEVDLYADGSGDVGDDAIDYVYSDEFLGVNQEDQESHILDDYADNTDEYNDYEENFDSGANAYDGGSDMAYDDSSSSDTFDDVM